MLKMVKEFMVELINTYINILVSVMACYMIFVHDETTKLNVDMRFFVGFAITAAFIVTVKRIYKFVQPKLLAKLTKLLEDETEELA